MNWDYWLFWRNNSDMESEDSTYEDEVIEDCDHEFEESTELLDTVSMTEAKIEKGYLVVPQYEVVEEFCTECGKPGVNGEVAPTYDKNTVYLSNYDGKRSRVARKLAFKPDFEIDPDLSVADALTEPVHADADYVGIENGQVTTVENEDGSGRVLVNQSEKADYEVTD